MKNLSYKLQVLNENRGNVELKEYVETTSQSDPNFFRWLFDEDFDNDFDMSMTEEQKEEFKSFVNSL
jgi:hypothetical protein